MNTKKISLISSALAFIPMIAAAQTRMNLGNFIWVLIGYLNLLLVLIMAVAFVMFVWNVVLYFIRPVEGAKRAEAGKYVMYSLIGFFVILSFWGLVNILQNTFNVDNVSNRSTWEQFLNIFPGGGGGGGSSVNRPYDAGLTSPPQSYDEAIRRGNR